jgi:hypothetical protein
MSGSFPAEGVWRPIEYAEVWAAYDARFDFKPDPYERAVPAIRLPEICVVIDLAPGEELVRTLGTELLTWLPRHPQSP